MSELSGDIIRLFNDAGSEVLKEVMEMGKTESFRNYMIQNFRWFCGNIVPHSIRHRCEAAWYRFYLDHGRLIKQIDYRKIIDGSLTEDEVIEYMTSVADAYKEQHGLDVLSPDKEIASRTLKLEGF